MSERTRPPFRADHVGSLLRPPELLEAREAHAAGGSTTTGSRRPRTRRSATSCRMQEEAGLQSVTDGEFRRASWHMDFIYSLDGVSKAPGNIVGAVPQRRGRHRVHARPRCTSTASSACRETIFERRLRRSCSRSRARRRRRSSRSRRRAWSTTAAAAPPSTSRSTPTWTASGTTSPRPTPRRSGASASSAARYLQFDDTSLAYLNDPKQREMIAAQGSRRRAPARVLHLATSTRRSRSARGHGGHDAHVPRQLPLLVGGRGRLRLRRRGAVRPARGRRLLHGVGRRALGRLRAAALRARRASRSCSGS